MNTIKLQITLLALIIIALTRFAAAQTTVFTYQGRLTDGATAASGNYDLGFALYDAETGGTQIGTTLARPNVNVSNGIFTVQLDFGANPFASGANRFLQIAVKRSADANFTSLTPRQQLTAAPFSIQSLSAKTADGLSANCVGCVTDAQINSIDGAKVTGTVTKAANATNAANAENVSGIVAVANGGTGSSTKNFVDTTTAQTVGGDKTFSDTVSVNTLNAGSGGVAMNDNFLRLRDSGKNNYGMLYNTTVDGPEFRALGGFRWANGASGANERMILDSSGNLTVSGTISGTLANDSVSSAQVANGSLRLVDTAIYNARSTILGSTVGAHTCGFISFPSAFRSILMANDIVYVVPPYDSPAGFIFQPVFVTQNEVFNYPFCNVRNASSTLPTQIYRIFVVRP